MSDIEDILKLATDLGIDPVTGTIADERPKRKRGEAKPDYHNDPDWLALFDPECDCTMCPSIPCPNRGIQGYNGARYRTTTAKGTGLISEDEFFRRSRMPIAYRSCRIATWEPQNSATVSAVRGYLAEWPPKKPFLLLWGNKGTGKTHLAAGVQRYAWERHGKLSVFWPVRELLAHVKAQFDEDTATTSEAEIQRTLDYSPLLVLDDYGKEQDTPWARSFLFSLIDRRYSNGWPTVITTNQDPGDDPTADRILDIERTVTVTFSGPSHRQRTA